MGSKKDLMKEIKEKLNKWKDIACLWIGGLNIVNMLVLNLIYKFITVSFKILASYFVYINELILKLIMERQKTQNSQCKV